MKKFTNKIWKSMLAVMLIFLLFSLMTGLASAATDLEDGAYTIMVAAVNRVNDDPSRVDGNFKKPARLEVVNGEIHAVITMTDSDVVKDLSIDSRSSGNFEPAAVIGEDKAARETTYKFKIARLETPIVVQALIVPMGRTVSFRLAFDPATLTRIAPEVPAAGQITAISAATAAAAPAAAPAAPAPPAAAPAPAAQNILPPKTNDSGFFTIVGLILAVVLLSGATYHIHLKGKRAAENN